MNSSQNGGLSPSCIALFFDGFGSILWYSIWFLSALSQFSKKKKKIRISNFFDPSIIEET
jgi:hypothetical protein